MHELHVHLPSTSPEGGSGSARKPLSRRSNSPARLASPGKPYAYHHQHSFFAALPSPHTTTSMRPRQQQSKYNGLFAADGPPLVPHDNGFPGYTCYLPWVTRADLCTAIGDGLAKARVGEAARFSLFARGLDGSTSPVLARASQYRTHLHLEVVPHDWRPPRLSTPNRPARDSLRRSGGHGWPRSASPSRAGSSPRTRPLRESPSAQLQAVSSESAADRGAALAAVGVPRIEVVSPSEGSMELQVAYSPLASGPFKLLVMLDGVHVAGSPFQIEVLPGLPHRLRSLTPVSRLRGPPGVPLLCELGMVDAHGNAIDRGGNLIDVVIEQEGAMAAAAQGASAARSNDVGDEAGPHASAPAPSVHSALEDLGNGIYSVSILSVEPGAFRLRASLRGDTAALGDAKGDDSYVDTLLVPLIFRYADAAAAEPANVGTGPAGVVRGLRSDGVRAGESISFFIVVGEGAKGAASSARHGGKGSARRGGGSSQRSSSDGVARPNLGAWLIGLQPPAGAGVGSTTDGRGAALGDWHGGAQGVVPMLRECSVREVDDGTARGDGALTVTLSCETAGDHWLGVQYRAKNGAIEHLPGSPYPFRVLPGPVHAPTCTASGAILGERSAGLAAGEEGSITVFLRDAYRNLTAADASALLLGGARGLSARLVHVPAPAPASRAPISSAPPQSAGSTAPSGTAESDGKVVAAGPGQATVTFSASVAGLHEAHVRVDGTPIHGSPFAILVRPAPPHAAGCELSVRGAQGATAAAGEVEIEAGGLWEARLKVADRFGNRAESGGDVVSALLLSGSAPHTASVEDKHDGTYQLSARPLKAGRYSLQLRVNGELAALRAPQLVVRPAPPDASQCRLVRATRVEGAVLRVGEVVTFSFEARDAHGNARPAGGDGFRAWFVPDTHGAARVEDGADGTYTVVCEPVRSGRCAVAVHSATDNAPIAGSPFHVRVRPGTVCAERCTAHGEGLIGSTPFREYAFIVRARDSHGNARREGGDSLTAVLRSVEHGHYGDILSITDRGDGTYAVRYRVTISGAYLLEVCMAREHIAGSPFALTFHMLSLGVARTHHAAVTTAVVASRPRRGSRAGGRSASPRRRSPRQSPRSSPRAPASLTDSSAGKLKAQPRPGHTIDALNAADQAVRGDAATEERESVAETVSQTDSSEGGATE